MKLLVVAKKRPASDKLNDYPCGNRFPAPPDQYPAHFLIIRGRLERYRGRAQRVRRGSKCDFDQGSSTFLQYPYGSAQGAGGIPADIPRVLLDDLSFLRN
jgi:hypothetical protein